MKNISANLILQLVIIVSGFIMPKLLIRSFGSDTYGLVASITQFLSLIMLLEAGIGPVIKAKLYKYIANNDKNKILLVLKDADRFLKKIGFIFIVYVIVLCFLYPIMNDEFEANFTIIMIIIMSIGTLCEYFFGIIYNLYLQADKKYYITSNIQIVCYILNIILVVLLVNMGASIIAVKIANTLAFIIKPIFQSYYVRKKLNIHFEEAKGEYKIDNKYDGLSQHVAYVIYSNTAVSILTIFTNLATVAVYSVYNLVSSALKNVVSAFSNGMDSIFGDMFARKEKDVLRRSFGIYEFLYYTVVLIFFLTAIILIIPFIKIYTNGITDANYIHPLFAILLMIGGIVGCIRVIYSTLVYSIGHFKQTNMICWVEAIVNLVLSVIGVIKFGLMGIAIGPIVSTLIRLLYFMWYASKVVLERDNIINIKWLFIVTLQTVICSLLTYYVIDINPANYFEWVLYGAFVLLVVSIFVIGTNILFNYSLFKEVLSFLKEKFREKRNHV